MPADRIFDIANIVALLAWALLLFSPFVPRWSDRMATLAAPALLALFYVGSIGWLVSLSLGEPSADGAAPDFSTLDGVAALFSEREAVLVGWIHFLAFDLFVGAWVARTGRRDGVPFWLVVPCLVLTLFAGPAGFLLFLFVRALSRQSAVAAT